MCLRCYQSDDSRHNHQRTNESQILFQPWCHLYTRKTTVDREQSPTTHQTKQVPTEISLHWLQPFVAYCTEMNQSILKFFHLCHIHGVCISEVHEKACQRHSWSPMKMYLLDLLLPNFWPNHLYLWSTEFHSYDSSWKHVACLTEACVYQDEP